MATFFTADLHLGHARISELAGRPFSSVQAMNAALINAWNARVTSGDTVFVLGDVCMGKLDDSLALIPLLFGRKILVPGNHDRCWEGNPKFEAQVQRYLDAGFDQIIQPPLLHSVHGTPVLLSHFPYRGDSRPENPDRYAEERPVDFGAWMLHGHSHGQWRQRDRMIDVGVDAWAGRPVLEDAIAGLIAAGPADLPPRSWRAQVR